MKKLLSLLAIITIASAAAWGYTVQFDFTTGFANNQRLETVTNGGVSITFLQGKSTNWPVWLESSQCLRVYAKNGFTISCDSEIESFTISFKSADHTFITGNNEAPTVSTGTYSETGLKGTWNGNAKSITLTAGGTKGHARIDSIAVTFKGEAPEGSITNPIITPSSASFSESQEVTITCDDKDAEIHYTLDESEPTAASALYTGPFTVTETTTVKAIAIKGDAVSQVVTAKFTLLVGVESISEFLSQPDGTMMVFNFPVTVIHQYEKQMFVQDEWGMGMRVFGYTGQTYERGDVIPAGFTGTKVLYGAEPELDVFYTNYFKPATEKTEPLATLIDAIDVGPLYHADYVVVPNIMIIPDEDDNFYMINIDDDYGMGFLGTFKTITLPEDLTQRYDVVGIVSSHYTLATVYQLLPLQFVVHGDTNADKAINVGDVAVIYDGILSEAKSVAGVPKHVSDLLLNVNGDEYLNVGDVAATYQLILGASEE